MPTCGPGPAGDARAASAGARAEWAEALGLVRLGVGRMRGREEKDWAGRGKKKEWAEPRGKGERAHGWFGATELFCWAGL